MNRYYKTLELDKILSMLGEMAENERTAQLVRELTPSSDLDAVRREMDKTAAAFELAVKNGTAPSYKYKDMSLHMDRALSGASLSPGELLEVAQMLRQIGSMYNYRRDADVNTGETVLDEMFMSLTPNDWLEQKIRNAIISPEEISDTASPALADIRRKIARAGIRIRESLDKMLKSAEVQKTLQENIITVRDGRYVIPVKAEHKGAVRGIVHAASASGNTLFIEPEAVVEANNDIRVLEGQEQAEIERILAELSSDCAACAETVKRDYETVSELLYYFIKAELGAKMNSTVPQLSDDGITDLRRARHPLLDKRTAVPVDIKLGEGYDALIVTGPNTGGKTVLLKTAGLLTAMAMCGLMIPASDGSKISVFDHILVDIGDMQSIEESLSTFSSHMSNIVDILSKADGRSLVLLDELGGGTDPVEGAALAVSVIEQLMAQGAKVFVTTHYQELKVFAMGRDDVMNASCEFDEATLRPTYRLIIGAPGKSNAFEVSQRLGVPAGIVSRARELVSENNARFEEAVANLERARKEFAEKTAETERIMAEQKKALEEAEAERDRLYQSREAELEKARVQAMRIIENCRLESDKLLDELADIRKAQNKEEFQRRAAEAKSRARSAMDRMYTEANPINKREEAAYTPPRPFKKGDTVMVTDLKKTGVLSGTPDVHGNVFVQMGVMRTKTNISKLRLIEQEKPAQRKGSSSRSQVTGKQERRGSLELDIRGYAVDEGILETDIFIDNAVMMGAGIVTIIHGKGTGQLRQGIQRHLKSHPSVKSFRDGVYGEGEHGVTVVELK
ncbi:MAG: endonuclease MutS2 [Oscillospiraceae bacterium]|nr:endonuclease MutS2 [Oscillospiraceae bacterium]